MEQETWQKIDGSALWLPEKGGEELVGEVTQIDTAAAYGTQWVIRKSSGGEVRTPSHKVLQSRMSKVKIGDTVKIVYKGKEAPTIRGQNPTQMYEVYRKNT